MASYIRKRFYLPSAYAGFDRAGAFAFNRRFLPLDGRKLLQCSARLPFAPLWVALLPPQTNTHTHARTHAVVSVFVVTFIARFRWCDYVTHTASWQKGTDGGVEFRFRRRRGKRCDGFPVVVKRRSNRARSR